MPDGNDVTRDSFPHGDEPSFGAELSWRQDPSVEVTVSADAGNNALVHSLSGSVVGKRFVDVCVVLSEGKRQVIPMNRAEALFRGYTVLDADPELMRSVGVIDLPGDPPSTATEYQSPVEPVVAIDPIAVDPVVIDARPTRRDVPSGSGSFDDAWSERVAADRARADREAAERAAWRWPGFAAAEDDVPPVSFPVLSAAPNRPVVEAVVAKDVASAEVALPTLEDSEVEVVEAVEGVEVVEADEGSAPVADPSWGTLQAQARPTAGIESVFDEVVSPQVDQPRMRADEGVLDMFNTDSSESVRPELVMPMWPTADTMIASPTSQVAPLTEVADDEGLPATREVIPWGVEPPAEVDRRSWVPEGTAWPSLESDGPIDVVEDVAADVAHDPSADRFDDGEFGESAEIVSSAAPIDRGELDAVTPWAVVPPVLDAAEPLEIPLWPVIEPAPLEAPTIAHVPVYDDVQPEYLEPEYVEPEPYFEPEYVEAEYVEPEPQPEPPLPTRTPWRDTQERQATVTRLFPLREPEVAVTPEVATPEVATVEYEEREPVPVAQAFDTDFGTVAVEPVHLETEHLSSSAVPSLSVRQVSRSVEFKGERETTLNEVSFDLVPGDLFVINASSGAGSTTLLRCLIGLEPTSSGRITINGDDMTAWSDGDRARFRAAAVGYVPQDVELIEDLPAIDNTALPLLAAGWTGQAAAMEAERVLSLVGLADRIHHFPLQLSRGERQRVAVARAIAGDPLMVFADDPTASLDDDHAREVIGALLGHHRRGATLCIVSRDPRFNVAGARLARLHNGSLALDGSLAGGSDR